MFLSINNGQQQRIFHRILSVKNKVRENNLFYKLKRKCQLSIKMISIFHEYSTEIRNDRAAQTPHFDKICAFYFNTIRELTTSQPPLHLHRYHLFS